MEELFTKENQVITIIIIGVLLLLLMGVALLLFFFFSRKKILAKELEKNVLKVNHQKKIIQSIIITQEKERKRIAQDLHDDISSRLNVISLNTNLLKDKKLSPEEYNTVHNGILEATEKTLESARTIAHNLLPPILEEFGLKDALEELIDSFNHSKKVTIEYQIKYPKNHLSSQGELHLFRIIQELINNSIKHGKAKNVSIDVFLKEDKLILNYSDDGIGFDSNKIGNKKGLGIKNIESRISILNGKYNISSEIGKGFKILVII